MVLPPPRFVPGTAAAAPEVLVEEAAVVGGEVAELGMICDAVGTVCEEVSLLLLVDEVELGLIGGVADALTFTVRGIREPATAPVTPIGNFGWGMLVLLNLKSGRRCEKLGCLLSTTTHHRSGQQTR